MNDTFASLISAVENAARRDDAPATEAAVHELSFACMLQKAVPDQVIRQILEACSNPALRGSQTPAHMLNLFEFESERLTPTQRKEVLGFVKRNEGTFTHVHSRQVVTELIHGEYLR